MSLTAQQRPFLAMAYVLDSAKRAELQSFIPENIKANWNSLPTIPRGGKLLSNDRKQYMFGVILYDLKNSRSDLSQAGPYLQAILLLLGRFHVELQVWKTKRFCVAKVNAMNTACVISMSFSLIRLA